MSSTRFKKTNRFKFNKYLVLLLIVNAFSAKSQFHIFAGPGYAYYQGDVSDVFYPTLKTSRFSWKAAVGYDFHPRWGVRGHYSKSTLHGSDSYSNDVSKQVRGVTFTTKLTDIGVTAKYKYLFKKSYRFINYGFFGFDYMNMSVARDVNGNASLVQENSFSSTQFNIPIGIGLGRWFSAHWGVVYEISYHYALTDYLDGTSLVGNPKANDSYIDNFIMLIYRFGGGGNADGTFDRSKLNNVDCPKWGY